MEQNYNYAYSSNVDMDPAVGMAVGGAFFVFFLVLALVFYVYTAYTLMRIAQKLNAENAWFAWVPILNIVLMLQLAQKPVWWILLLFVPVINAILALIGTIIVWMEIAKRLKEPEWLGVLMFISPINLIILGYLAFKKSSALPAKAAEKSA